MMDAACVTLGKAPICTLHLNPPLRYKKNIPGGSRTVYTKHVFYELKQLFLLWFRPGFFLSTPRAGLLFWGVVPY
jgi:hypothetical protein